MTLRDDGIRVITAGGFGGIAVSRPRTPGRRVETAVLQVVLITVFAAEVLSGDDVRTRAVDRVFGFSAAAISEGEVWRLGTPAFLHTFPGRFDDIGLQHLVLNSAVLWIVGPSLRVLATPTIWWATAAAGAICGFGAMWVVGTDLTGFGGSSAMTWSLMACAIALWVVPGGDRKDAGRRLGLLRYALLPCASWLVIIQPIQVVAGGLHEPQVVHGGAAAGGVAVALLVKRLGQVAPRFRATAASGGEAVATAEIDDLTPPAEGPRDDAAQAG